MRIARAAFFLLGFILAVDSAFAAAPGYVRILVVKDSTSLSLKADGFYEVQDLKRKTLLRSKNLRTTAVVSKGGISLGKNVFKQDKILIRADDPQVILINGRKFRGDICLIRGNSKISSVNYIDLDDYVRGVLIFEASHYWPIEALKALVVVVRSFALYQAQQNAARDYDMTSDIYSQVYGGRTAERYRLNEAVDGTQGMVLTYQGKILPAFHHATCAGHTEDAKILWNVDLPPLKGVKCDFCGESPHFNWHLVKTVDEIKEALSAGGYKVADIKDIVASGKTSSGRISELTVVSDNGNTLIAAKDFRNLVGPNEIKSTNFKVRRENDDIVFEGLGWGHGVGFCQWGAYFMAKDNYDFRKILEYYYPGAQVEIRN